VEEVAAVAVVFCASGLFLEVGGLYAGHGVLGSVEAVWRIVTWMGIDICIRIWLA
jgi:hypothetical protein